MLSAGTFAQVLFEVTPAGFNTREFDEFAPVIYGNGLVFNTYRKQHLYKTEVDADDKNINDIYFVQKSANGEWGELQYFSKELNSKNHEGKATFTKDGNTIYFTRFFNPEGSIIKAVKSGGEWVNPVPVSLNSEKYRIKDPCVSADGKKMYFSSMAPGGFGGYDLYVSTFERGDWSAPKNLGPLVNTKGDELSPFIHANGKLYFSSDKLPNGLGRFDIYYTREVNGNWITPKHLPEPVNSTRDDMYYVSDADDSNGYFSSNRNRSFDIFGFHSLWPKFTDCKPQEINEYTYIFYEKGTVDNDTTTWMYEWDFGDGTKARGKKAEAEHTFAGTGQYMVQLNIVDTLTGEILLNEDTYPFNVTDIEQAFITCPDTITAGLEVLFDASLTNLPQFKEIEYYYWEFGDGERATGISPRHIFPQPGKYTVHLCVQSAPESSGSPKKACVSKEILVRSP
jgi:hypothetical protein